MRRDSLPKRKAHEEENEEITTHVIHCKLSLLHSRKPYPISINKIEVKETTTLHGAQEENEHN